MRQIEPMIDPAIGTRAVPDWPYHRIGSDGSVWRQTARGWFRLKQQRGDKMGYMYVHLSSEGKKKRALVHRLVLLAFVGPPADGMVCRHLDGNPRNNIPSNLKWDTVSENLRDRKRHGYTNHGEINSQAKLTVSDVAEIRRLRGMGEKLVVLADRFGVSFQTISNIARRKTWTHPDDTRSELAADGRRKYAVEPRPEGPARG
jgi:hypothetical protein